MAVEALDAGIVTHLTDVLAHVSQQDHRRFACCPQGPARSAEYLTHFFKRHFDSASAPRETLTPKQLILKDAEADAYRELKAKVHDSIVNDYYVEDKYWDTYKVLDTNNGANMVILHDYRAVKEAAQRLRHFFWERSDARAAAELRLSLNLDDRVEFLHDVYSQQGALAFVGERYSVEDAATLYGQIYTPAETVQHLEESKGMGATSEFIASRHTIDEAWGMYEEAFNPLAAFVRTYAAYGKDAALGYLATHYPSHEAGEMIREALPEDEIWAATYAAFKDRIVSVPAQPTPVPSGGAPASPDAQIALYK